jgi:hypothetical protein
MEFLSGVTPEGDRLKELANGDPDAMACAQTLWCYIHWLDDCIDKDKVLTHEDSAQRSMDLLLMLSFNRFWEANKSHLVPVLLVGLNSWLDSERAKHHPDYRFRAAADVWKSVYGEVFYQIALLTGGYEHMRKMALKWRGVDFDAKPGDEPDKEEKAPVSDRPVREWAFPKDHLSHPEFPVEWFYWSGILEGDGKRIGYHVCKFGSGDHCPLHFSTFDLDTGEYFTYESLCVEFMCHYEAEKTSKFTIKVGLKSFSFAMAPAEVYLQGGDGVTVKGEHPSEFSHHYSVPKIATQLTIFDGQKESILTGNSWFDHEFMPFIPDKIRWAWFYANLPDGWINGYILIKDDYIDGNHSRVTLFENGSAKEIGKDLSCNKIPTIDEPEFVLHDTTRNIKIDLLLNKKEVFKSKIRNYLELPCRVSILGIGGEIKEGTGYLEVAS